MSIPTPFSVRNQEFKLVPSSMVGTRACVVSYKPVPDPLFSLRSAAQVARYCQSIFPVGISVCPGENEFYLSCPNSKMKKLCEEVELESSVELHFGADFEAPIALRVGLMTFTASCALLRSGWMHVGSGFDTLISLDGLLPSDGDIFRDVRGFSLQGEADKDGAIHLLVTPSMYRVYPLRDSELFDWSKVVSLPRCKSTSIRVDRVSMPKSLCDVNGLRNYWAVVHGIRLPDDCRLDTVHVSFGKICLGYPRCCLWSQTFVRLPASSANQACEIFTIVETHFKTWEALNLAPAQSMIVAKRKQSLKQTKRLKAK
jgi:hypothetical protein